MKILTGVSLILGSFIGAGFVSGREIAFYFGRFGNGFVLAIIIATILFFLLTYFFFYLSKSTYNIDMFSKVYFGKLSGLINGLLIFSIFIISSSMLAGTKALAEGINIDHTLVMIITVFATYIVVKGNINSLQKTNLILLPLILIVLLIVCWVNKSSTIINYSENIFKIIFTGSNYVFINIVTLGMFILEIGNRYTKKESLLISWISSLVIGLLLILLCSTIIKNDLINESMPNLVLAKKNKVLFAFMLVCIYLGLFTTLISNVLILTNFMKKYLGNQGFSLILVLLMSWIFSNIGFSFIVGYVYSLIGIIGLVMITGVIVIKNRKRIKSFPT